MSFRIGGWISKPKTVPILRGILKIVGLKWFFKRGLSIIFTLQKFCYGLNSDSLLLWSPLIWWFATRVLCWIYILLSWRGFETIRFRFTRFWLFWDNRFVSKGRRDDKILALLGRLGFICLCINLGLLLRNLRLINILFICLLGFLLSFKFFSSIKILFLYFEFFFPLGNLLQLFFDLRINDIFLLGGLYLDLFFRLGFRYWLIFLITLFLLW